MTEPSKAPTIEELLNRIVKLEDENSRLHARCDDLVEAFKSHVDGDLADSTRIYDLLWALVDKVFPNLREMQSKMNAVVPPCWVDPSIDRRPHEYKRG
jgi:hypothetical protein